MERFHLVILKKPYLDAILEGRKTVESRFTKAKRAPFDRVKAGDRLLLKVSSGPVVAAAQVRKVLQFIDLTPPRIKRIRTEYGRQIGADPTYWQAKQTARYGVLIWLKNIRPIKPVWITKRDWRAWVVLTRNEHFGLLKPKHH